MNASEAALKSAGILADFQIQEIRSQEARDELRREINGQGEIS